MAVVYCERMKYYMDCIFSPLYLLSEPCTRLNFGSSAVPLGYVWHIYSLDLKFMNDSCEGERKKP